MSVAAPPPAAESIGMTKTQEHIKARIVAAVRASGCQEIVYCSEWLGFLPYGVYHWITCANKDITRGFTFLWSVDDLAALEASGFLEKLGECRDPEEEFDYQITYRVHLAE